MSISSEALSYADEDDGKGISPKWVAVESAACWERGQYPCYCRNIFAECYIRFCIEDIIKTVEALSLAVYFLINFEKGLFL